MGSKYNGFPVWRFQNTVAPPYGVIFDLVGGGGKGGDPARRTGKGKGKAVSAPRPPGKFHAGPLTRQSPQGSPSHPQPRPPQSMRVVAGWCQECGWRHHAAENGPQKVLDLLLVGLGNFLDFIRYILLFIAFIFKFFGS